MNSIDIREIEKTITEQMNSCPCCGSKGVCTYLGYGMNYGEHKFYVGCQNNECGLQIGAYECEPAKVPQEAYTKEDQWYWNNLKNVRMRTPEEMLKLWNSRV